MARSGLYPGAKHELIPAGDNDPPIDPRIAILHVAVSMVESLFDFFLNRSGGVESHFYVNWFGRVKQYRSIYRQADANLLANDFAVSIETAGFGLGKWNFLQRRAIKRLLLWLHAEAGIPLVKCPRWDGSGVGYHVMFGAPGPWTPVAKSCPGPDRIKQFHGWLVPWMKTATNPKEWDEMATKAEIKDAVREVLQELVGGDGYREFRVPGELLETDTSRPFARVLAAIFKSRNV